MIKLPYIKGMGVSPESFLCLYSKKCKLNVYCIERYAGRLQMFLTYFRHKSTMYVLNIPWKILYAPYFQPSKNIQNFLILDSFITTYMHNVANQ